jgi:hypothetical protein
MEWYWWVILFIVVAIVVGTAVVAANRQKLIEAKERAEARRAGIAVDPEPPPVEETPPDGSA